MHRAFLCECPRVERLSSSIRESLKFEKNDSIVRSSVCVRTNNTKEGANREKRRNGKRRRNKRKEKKTRNHHESNDTSRGTDIDERNEGYRLVVDKHRVIVAIRGSVLP